jgi:hypothetical protein
MTGDQITIMYKNRILSFSLLLALLISTASACGSNSNSPTVTSNLTDTTTSSDDTTEISRINYPDSLPKDLDFKGQTIRIICRDVETNIQEVYPEQTGDIVDDAVYNRNRMIEERLNITLEAIIRGTDANLNAEAIRNSIMAGSDEYDIVSGIQHKVLPQALEGMYMNLNNSKYIDLTQPWWWNDYINELKIGDKATYFLNGDISLTSIQNMSCIFFNKEMIADLGSSADEMYNLVLDGNWTYDELNKYSRLAYRDVNGDSNRDEGDIYGFMARTQTEPDHFTYTAGNVMYKRDKDGIPSLNVNTEYFIGYMETLYNLYYNNECLYITKDESLMRSRFAEGGTLFLINRFVSANYLRDMKAEYGIIPFPKYSQDQENYGALVHDSATVYCVPSTCARFDAATATLEALCAQSYRTVVPAYYDMALKVKYTSDSTAGIIIDMIKSAARTDFVYAYNYALNNAGLICRTMIDKKITDFASTWAGISSKAEKGLQDIIDLYSQLEG